jgi:hypothetical protein
MDTATLKALQESIAAWKKKYELVKRAEPEEVVLGVKGCPLCAVFNRLVASCIGCPVALKCKARSCIGTPYLLARNAISTYSYAVRYNEPKQAARNAALKATKAEIEFLKSLLPK